MVKAVKDWVPNRQDVIWIDCNPRRGQEMRDVHPFLVLSPKVFNEPSPAPIPAFSLWTTLRGVRGADEEPPVGCDTSVLRSRHGGLPGPGFHHVGAFHPGARGRGRGDRKPAYRPGVIPANTQNISRS
nr:type II toxin-antitoxin system PemK/MazF family toxin [Thiocapsa sp.]